MPWSLVVRTLPVCGLQSDDQWPLLPDLLIALPPVTRSSHCSVLSWCTSRCPAAADLGRDDKLLLRIRHKDPRRSIVKEHNHMVLRADSPQTKFEWINRMMQVCAGTVPPAKQQDKDKDPSSNGRWAAGL